MEYESIPDFIYGIHLVMDLPELWIYEEFYYIIRRLEPLTSNLRSIVRV